MPSSWVALPSPKPQRLLTLRGPRSQRLDPVGNLGVSPARLTHISGGWQVAPLPSFFMLPWGGSSQPPPPEFTRRKAGASHCIHAWPPGPGTHSQVPKTFCLTYSGLQQPWTVFHTAAPVTPCSLWAPQSLSSFTGAPS